MTKGLYIFDSEAKEFRRRDNAKPWDVRGDVAVIEDVESSKPVSSSKDVEPVDQEVDTAFVDPTSLRRRRTQKKHSSRSNSADSISKEWHRAMWILIALMAMAWIMMVYTHSRKARQFPQDERFFHFDRQEILKD